MKVARIFITTGVLATVSLLGSSIPAVAGQINSICKTDDQTFKAIKASADQTVWSFMQAVCRGEFVITQSPEIPRTPDLAQLPRSEDAPQDVLGVDSSKGAPSPLVTPMSTAQATPTKLPDGVPPGASGFKEPGPNEVEPSEALAVSPETPKAKQSALTPIPNATSTVGSVAVNESPMVENSPTVIAPSAESVKIPSDGIKSKRPTRYSLLASQTSDAFVEELPAPITYRPSRFSNYKPDYLMESTASQQGAGFLQKPAVMSVSPQGFFTSLFWHSYEEPGLMEQKGPGFALGYVDERALREWQDYPGQASRFEIGLANVQYRGSGKLRNFVYYGIAEVYQPIMNGFFVGLGYRRLMDDKVPEDIGRSQVVVSTTGARAYDRLSQYLYIPIGFAGRLGGDETIKVQLNALLKGRQTSYLSQTFLDVDVNNDQNKGWGIDAAYAPSRNGELFLRYWAIEDSERFRSPVTGAIYWEPKNETLEIGYRVWW